MMKKFLGTPPLPQRVETEPEMDALRKRVAELEARLKTDARGKRRKRVKH
jgi:BMFP domain-containing protein YqiC